MRLLNFKFIQQSPLFKRDVISLCTPSSSGIFYVDQACLELTL